MVTLNRAAYQKIERTNEWACLSTDAYTNIENFLGILNGDELTLIDTGAKYLFNADTQAWVLQPTSGGGDEDTGVESFNGRTGDVVPMATDYPPSLIGAVNKAGDTMTGNLNMDGHAITGLTDALEDTDALPKGQADDIYVNVTGDTMSGDLNMDGSRVTGVSSIVAEGSTVDNIKFESNGEIVGILCGGDRSVTFTASAVDAYDHTITRVGTPTQPTDAARKQDVDAVQTAVDTVSETVDAIIDGTEAIPYLPEDGGTLSGPLNMGNNKITMGGTPTATTDVTNKGYVDGVVKVISDELDGVIAGTTPITLPIASDTHLGGVIVGDGLSVDPTGTLSVDADQAPTQGSENPVQSGGVYNALQGYIPTTQKGANSGVAELDENGFVPASQLPGFVDDIVDAYVVGSTPFAADWLSLTNGGQPFTPDASKIYLVVSAGEYQYQEYRWSGTIYGQVNSGLALGETANTAFRGDQGKTAYDHSQITQGNPHGTTAEDVGARPNTWMPTAAETGAIPLPVGGADGKFLKSTGDGQTWDTIGVYLDSEAQGISWSSTIGQGASSNVSADCIALIQDAVSNHRPLFVNATVGNMTGTIVMTESATASGSLLLFGLVILPGDPMFLSLYAIMQINAENNEIVTIINLLGTDGPQGEAAGFGTVTATVDDTSGTPSVQVTTSGPDTAKNFSFAFSGLKGEQGEPGTQGPEGPQGMQGEPGPPGEPAGFGIIDATVDDTVGTPSVNVMTSGTNSALDISFEFTGLKGQTGEQGPQGEPGINGANGSSAFMPVWNASR